MEEKELKKLKTLNKINIDEKIKKVLRKEVERWRQFIKEERGNPVDEGNEMHAMYHSGEISFIEFFFNLPKDKIKIKNKK